MDLERLTSLVYVLQLLLHVGEDVIGLILV